MMFSNISKKKLFVWIGVIVVVAGVGIFLARYKNEVNISGTGSPKNKKASSIAGLECANADARPFAVMVSSDAEARPLSGIGEADMVFEMPVVENGFTRMMAVYQCGQPREIGSVRSSRLDFVPLALGIKAIYAHFGGEHTVLEELNSGVIDNIDGLKYDGTIYYRKSNIPRPHNAFTTPSLLKEISTRLRYDTGDSYSGYPHDKNSDSQGTEKPPLLFKEPFAVNWTYNKDTNSYLRARSGKSEIDKNTGKQVEAKNIVVMETTWSPISKDYIRVKTLGSGNMTLYKNGQKFTGTWQKKDDKSKLYFYDQNGKEIKFAPGSTWIEITTQ